MIVFEPQAQFFLGADFHPDSDPRMVVKWCKTNGEVVGSQRGKAYKLCEYDCIRYAGSGLFLSLPLDTNTVITYAGQEFVKKPFLKDYNRDPEPYVLRKVGGEWLCSCQWNKNMQRTCAHLLALKIEFKRKKFVKEAME